MQTKKIGPGVVADAVHHALALDDQRHVEIGHQDAFTFLQGRRQVAAFRADDRRAAAAAQALLQCWVGLDSGYLRVGKPTCGVHHEAAGFERVVAECDFHLVRKDRADE